MNKYFSSRRLLHYIADLSKYHRIQGSPGLEEAAGFIRDSLNDWVLDVSIYDFNYLEEYGFNTEVLGWWVKDGQIEMVSPKKKILGRFKDASTVVAAHSPPGEFEGKVAYVGRGEPEDFKGDLDGKVILTHGRGIDVYEQAVKSGATAVIFFRFDGDENGIPYTGLFPSTSDKAILKIPALSISRKDALEIIRYLERDKEVTIKGFVEAGFRDTASARVVEASLGKGNEEIHLVAHYCHPADTINDNVSGSATLLEMANSIAEAIEDGKLNPQNIRKKIVFVWVPEYYGSLPYLANKLKEGSRIEFAINLDMIGEKQDITGSILNMIRSPIRLMNYGEALLYKELMDNLPARRGFSTPYSSLSIRFTTLNYESGSDHDIYTSFNISAVMILQWPDKFYHSSLDSLDKIDLRIIRSISAAVTNTALKLANSTDTFYDDKYFTLYALSQLSNDLMKLNSLNQVYNARLWLYCKYVLSKLKTDFIHIRCPSEIVGGGPVIKRTKAGIVGGRYLRKKLGKDKYNKMKKFLREEPWYRTAFLSLLPLIAGNGTPMWQVYHELVGEIGAEIGKELFTEIVSLLEEADVINKQSN
jgi:Zn-dependent M28 family amino/carboxypeptidase